MSARTEVERIKAVSAHMVQRARKDPKVAHAFLRDIGYYKMMGKDAPASVTATKAVKSSPRKNASASSKTAKAKR